MQGLECCPSALRFQVAAARAQPSRWLPKWNAVRDHLRAMVGGTLTLLFTDIQGSTRMLDRLGERYRDLLAEHHRVIREAIGAAGGREVDTAGDSFFAVFARAGDAVLCAQRAQRALSLIHI